MKRKKIQQLLIKIKPHHNLNLTVIWRCHKEAPYKMKKLMLSLQKNNLKKRKIMKRFKTKEIQLELI